MFVNNFNKLFKLFVHKQWKRFAGTYKLGDFALYLLEKGPEKECTITKDEALKMYTEMTMIRRMEMSLAELYKAKIVRGFCHLYNGQEATGVGIFNELRPEDTLITSYRAHGYAYLMGNHNAEKVIAELVGVETGCSKGKGGSMHVYANNFFGGNGIVGSQVPVGTGIGLFHKYMDTAGISFTIFGDGAANQGQVSESYNIAKLWNLPVIFVCENNLYGMGTASHRSSANPDYFRTCIYLPGILVDGMDLLSVRNATQFAIKHVTAGKGPIILEMRAYRYYGHSMSDPGSSYRSRDEIASVRKARDPIKTFAEMITSDKLVSQDELKAIQVKAKTDMKEVVEKVKSAKEVGLEHLTSDISQQNLEKSIRGINPFESFEHANFEPPK